MTISRTERVVQLLEKASNIYEQFLQLVQDDIIEPLAKGNTDKCRENLRRFGKKVSVSEIIRIVVRGANLLAISTLKSFDAMPKEKPRLSKEYIASRLEHFKDRIAKLNSQGANI